MTASSQSLLHREIWSCHLDLLCIKEIQIGTIVLMFELTSSYEVIMIKCFQTTGIFCVLLFAINRYFLSQTNQHSPL